MEVKSITDVRSYGDDIDFLCADINLKLKMMSDCRLKIINSTDVYFEFLNLKDVVASLMGTFGDNLSLYTRMEATGDGSRVPTMNYLNDQFYVLSETVKFLVDIGLSNDSAMMLEAFFISCVPRKDNDHCCI